MLALVPRGAVAQFANDNPFPRNEAPGIVTDFGAGRVRAPDEEFEADFLVLGTFAGPRRLDRFTRGSMLERPTPWRVYGRVGVFNFQSEMQPEHRQGLRLSWRRTGPKLTGRVYVGVYRTFD